MRRADIADSSHVGCKVIDLVDIPGHLQALGIVAKVGVQELVGLSSFESRSFDVDATYRVPMFDQILDEMMPYKPACTGHQNSRRLAHGDGSFRDPSNPRLIRIRGSGRSTIGRSGNGPLLGHWGSTAPR